MRLKTLKEFPDYQISDNGRIFSLKNKKRIELKPFLDTKQNYLVIKIFNKDGIRKHVSIHRLVAMAFVKKSKDKNLEVNHKDHNSLNNNYTNLEWVTHRENIHHSYETMDSTRNYKRCKLYKDKIFVKEFKSIKEAARYGKTHFNAKISMLEKYHKSNNITLKISQ